MAPGSSTGTVGGYGPVPSEVFFLIDDFLLLNNDVWNFLTLQWGGGFGLLDLLYLPRLAELSGDLPDKVLVRKVLNIVCGTVLLWKLRDSIMNRIMANTVITLHTIGIFMWDWVTEPGSGDSNWTRISPLDNRTWPLSYDLIPLTPTFGGKSLESPWPPRYSPEVSHHCSFSTACHLKVNSIIVIIWGRILCATTGLTIEYDGQMGNMGQMLDGSEESNGGDKVRRVRWVRQVRLMGWIIHIRWIRLGSGVKRDHRSIAPTSIGHPVSVII